MELAIEKEKYKQVVAAKYQSQKNQIALDMPTLFDDIEEEALKVEDSEIEEVITVGEHTWVHRPKEQHLSYDHLPKVDEYLSVPEGEDICEKWCVTVYNRKDISKRSRNHTKTKHVKLGDWKHEISGTTLQSDERGSVRDEAYTCRWNYNSGIEWRRKTEHIHILYVGISFQ